MIISTYYIIVIKNKKCKTYYNKQIENKGLKTYSKYSKWSFIINNIILF